MGTVRTVPSTSNRRDGLSTESIDGLQGGVVDRSIAALGTLPPVVAAARMHQVAAATLGLQPHCKVFATKGSHALATGLL